VIVKFAEHRRGGAAGRGDSFTATAKYLLDHDRPEWTATENLGTDNPYMAARVMAAVSMNAEELKARAGVSRAGRKKEHGDVFHVVVSWPEGTNPDQAHQAQAVRDVLKQIGLDKAQAVLAAHNDNGFAHVHAMVNLVNPEDGRLFNLAFSKSNAQAWALKYSQEHGDMTAPQREENARKRADNRQAHDQARESGAPSPALKLTRDERSLSRAEYERMREGRNAFFERQKAEREALWAGHSQEWDAAKEQIAANKPAYDRAFREERAKTRAADKEANRPYWREVKRRQETERAQALAIAARTQVEARLAADAARKATKAAVKAEKREGTLLGKVAKILGAQSLQEAQERQARAIEAAKVATARHKAAEAAKNALPGRQDRERRDIYKMLSEASFQKALAGMTVGQVDLAPMKARQAAERAALRERQDAERREAGLPEYKPKARKQDFKAIHAKTLAREQERDRDRDRQAADRQRRDQAPSPFARAAGTAKDQAEQDRRAREKQRAVQEQIAKKTAARSERPKAPEPQVFGKPARPRFGPPLTEAQLAKRRERRERERSTRARNDFENER